MGILQSMEEHMDYEVKGVWEGDSLVWEFSRGNEVQHRVSDRLLRSRVANCGSVIRFCHVEEYAVRFFDVPKN